MKSGQESPLKFKKQTIQYQDTGYFSQIVLDYLSEDEKLKSFYGLNPEIASFKNQINLKKGFEHRKVLVESLTRQYKAGGIKKVRFDNLLDENTFTITTGHQLCLFTGPLYFIYKIVTAIKSCSELKKAYPENDFVPVFWMASEDHDFDEANHFYLGNEKVEWESGQVGAVGRMSTVGMGELAEELKQHFGVGYHAAELHSLFVGAYTQHKNIAGATRYLVHQLFGEYGVISIDGDDPKLKALAGPYFRKEFTEQSSYKAVQRTSQELSEFYKLQVHPREINLFYLDEGLRERFVILLDNRIGVNRTDLHFSTDEIDRMLLQEPEKFSPNVILRPLYQEVILPNLAYIGGGGELAYWFQLKKVFEEHQVPFPILMLRNSAMFMSKTSEKTMKTLGLTERDLFLDEMQLEKLIILGNNSSDLNLDDQHDSIKEIFESIEKKLGAIDPTLEASTQSGLARTERIIKNLEKKMFRATRKKEKELIEKIQRLKDDLFPSGSLQERRSNFSMLYSEYGKEFIEACIQEFDPFDYRFTILSE